MRRPGLTTLLTFVLALSSAVMFSGALLSGTLQAQSNRVEFHLPIRTPKQSASIRLNIQKTPGSTRPGGSGYVRIDVRNLEESAHTVGLKLDQSSYGPSGFRARKSVRLAGSEQARVYLPIPAPAQNLRLTMRLDNDAPFGPRIYLPNSAGLAVLRISQLTEPNTTLPTILDSTAPKDLKGTGIQRLRPLLTRRANEIPGNWQLLSGFDLIILDFTDNGVSPKLLSTLADYLRMGGRLLLLDTPRSPDSSLARLIPTGKGSVDFKSGRSGFGHWVWASNEASLKEHKSRLATWGQRSGFFHARVKKHSGSAPDEFFKKLLIPGLGEVPVRLFFFLILVFAVLVGPVNLLYWRRKKKPQMLLLSVPIAGIAFTAMILTYGFAAEGFDIKGNIRSVTILDQRDHSAANITQRTLFAGMGPDSLDLEPGTRLDTDDRLRSWRKPQTHVIDMDLDHGNRLSGTVLPSRTETNLVTWTLSKTRERLAFERGENGRYRVIESGGLRRDVPHGDIVFRDPEGKYWVSSNDSGELMQDRTNGKQLRTRLMTGMEGMAYAVPPKRRNRYYYSRSSSEVNQFSPGMLEQRRTGVQLHQFLKNSLPLDLPPASYLMRVQIDPAVDAMGLDVRYESRYQLVLGLLAKEDIR